MQRKGFTPTWTKAVGCMGPIRKVLISLCALLILSVVPPVAYSETWGLFAAVNGASGNHAGSVYKYTSDGSQSTFASGLSRPRGLAFDSARNLFVASTFCEEVCHATIFKITPVGEQSFFGTIQGSAAQGMAIDGSDNVFVMTVTQRFHGSIIFRFTPNGHRKMFGAFHGQGMGLVFDNEGNLFAASAINPAIYKFAPDGTRSVFVGPEAFPSGEGEPIGLAFDQIGNLFVSVAHHPFTNDKILKFDPSGAKGTFASGLKNPRGLVFNGAGELYVAEWPHSQRGNIRKFTPEGVSTLFASDIGQSPGGGPTWLAFEP